MNKYYAFGFSILIILCGCHHKKSIEFSKLLIRKYQADTIPRNSGISSVHLVMENSIDLGKKGNNRWQKKGDTLGSLTYDPQGRLLTDDINPFEGFDYHYDSLGIVDHVRWLDWDIVVNFIVKYRISNDSLTIIQQFIDSYEKKIMLIHRYKFSDKGLLIEKEAPAYGMQRNDVIWNDRIIGQATQEKIGVPYDTTERIITYKYFYNSDEQIEQIETWSDSKQLPGRASNEIFYYSTKQLDSVILTYDHLKYQIKRYFDNKGLEQRRIYSDTLSVKFIYN